MNLLFLGASNTDCEHCFTSDSLGKGYVKFVFEELSVLCSKHGQNLTVTNGGTDGFTFPRIYEKWKTMYSGKSYDAVILLGGINEVGVIHNTGLDKAQTEEYLLSSAQSLGSLLQDLASHDISHIYLLEPFLFSSPAYLKLWFPTLERIRAMIMRCIVKYSGTSQIHYLPTQKELDSLASKHELSAVSGDGIHLMDAGHRCLTRLLINALNPLLPKC